MSTGDAMLIPLSTANMVQEANKMVENLKHEINQRERHEKVLQEENAVLCENAERMVSEVCVS